MQFDDVEDIPGRPSPSHMQSRERGGRRPGNEARCNLVECEVIFDIRMDVEGTLVAGSMESG